MNTTEATPEQDIATLSEANAELAERLALAERQRDEARAGQDAALKTAARHEAEARRLDAANKALRGRVAYQSQTIGILRGQLAVAGTRRVVERIDAVTDMGACACLSAASRGVVDVDEGGLERALPLGAPVPRRRLLRRWSR